MKIEKSLRGVDARLRTFYIAIIKGIWKNAYITETVRSPERQDSIFQNRRHLTPNRGMESAHQYGYAIDVGGINWTAENKAKMRKILANKFWQDIEWGGNWMNSPENWHFQIRNWRSFIDVGRMRKEYQNKKQPKKNLFFPVVFLMLFAIYLYFSKQRGGYGTV